MGGGEERPCDKWVRKRTAQGHGGGRSGTGRGLGPHGFRPPGSEGSSFLSRLQARGPDLRSPGSCASVYFVERLLCHVLWPRKL